MLLVAGRWSDCDNVSSLQDEPDPVGGQSAGLDYGAGTTALLPGEDDGYSFLTRTFTACLVQATVLIETLPAAFEMEEILYELKEHSAGLNCGRWDYIFSLIKTLREDPNAIMPDRSAPAVSLDIIRSDSIVETLFEKMPILPCCALLQVQLSMSAVSDTLRRAVTSSGSWNKPTCNPSHLPGPCMLRHSGNRWCDSDD